MGILNSVKNGADLTHPRLSLAWVIGGVIAAGLIMLVVVIASKAWGAVGQTNIPVVSDIGTAAARTYMS